MIKRSTYPTSMAVPTHEIVEGVLYDLDTRNGLNCTDSYYTPYDVTIEIAPFETFMVEDAVPLPIVKLPPEM